MDDEDKLFMSNPLKALWILGKENRDLLKRITQELDTEDSFDGEDSLNDNFGDLNE